MIKAIKHVWDEMQTISRVALLSLMAALAVLVGAAGWWGYEWFSRRQREHAFDDYTEVVKTYKSLKKATGQDDGQLIKLAEKIDLDAQKYKATSLYPFFRAYQSQLLLDVGQREKALSVLDDAIVHLKGNTYIQAAFELKRALIKQDSTESIAEEGHAELKRIADNSSHPFHDLARLYLTDSISEHGDADKARAILDDLAARVPEFKQEVDSRLARLGASTVSEQGE